MWLTTTQECRFKQASCQTIGTNALAKAWETVTLVDVEQSGHWMFYPFISCASVSVCTSLWALFIMQSESLQYKCVQWANSAHTVYYKPLHMHPTCTQGSTCMGNDVTLCCNVGGILTMCLCSVTNLYVPCACQIIRHFTSVLNAIHALLEPVWKKCKVWWEVVNWRNEKHLWGVS